jgi:hypothetical protein
MTKVSYLELSYFTSLWDHLWELSYCPRLKLQYRKCRMGTVESVFLDRNLGAWDLRPLSTAWTLQNPCDQRSWLQVSAVALHQLHLAAINRHCGRLYCQPIISCFVFLTHTNVTQDMTKTGTNLPRCICVQWMDIHKKMWYLSLSLPYWLYNVHIILSYDFSLNVWNGGVVYVNFGIIMKTFL